MKHIERSLFKQRALIKPVACLTLALSAIMSSHIVSATTATLPDGGVVWCNGDGSAYTTTTTTGVFPAIVAPGGVANPADSFDGWMSNPILINGVFGATAETVAPAGTANANDRYAIQLNYWNSKANSVAANATNAPFGYSAGHSCILFYYNTGNIGQFTITYPATSSVPRQAEIDWHTAHPNDFPTFVPYHNDDGSVNPTKGGPTGYVSTFKGCSWDDNSCTAGSAIPTGTAVPPKSTDINIFPEKLTDITSIPSQWNISFNQTYGNPGLVDKTKNAWDASYDIWFDIDAHTAAGHAPYGLIRGQNDGLEIMVWMNSNGSYVDSGAANKIPAEDQPGLVQPTGHIRERVVINGVLYDVWVGRLDNPYFGHTGDNFLGNNPTYQAAHPGQSDATAEPSTCTSLAVNGGNGTLCGAQWNVVSFVATKDNNGTDYRKNSMSLDAKVFADYILGIQDGLWTSYGTATDGTQRTAGQVLKCPADNKDQSLAAATANCLSSSWYLTSVQAGFETWIGGNGLQSDFFKAHVSTKSTGIQTGLTAPDGNPIINWVTPFDVIYSACTSFSASNHASFTITGTNNDTGGSITYPANGVPQDMGAQDPTTLQFTTTVNTQMAPMHGTANINFTSSCGSFSVPVYIDPSGRVFFADGKTPVQGAQVTLQYSTSGNSGGPFAVVPNNNVGLASPIMQPNDNTQNPMSSTATGVYAWNTVPGWYKVNANLTGCGSVTTAAQQVTLTHAVENLNITLPCAPPQPLPPPPDTSGVKVQLTLNGTDWAHGYCRNVVLTNTTSKPITWKVNFSLPFPNSVIDANNKWNLNYSQSGNSATAWGVGWNNVIQPGQVLKDQGFCASK